MMKIMKTTQNKIKVLDWGHVELVDHMGSDLTVVNSARVSFSNHKEEFEDKDEKLIRYLGLDWQTECLSPQNNRRSIATASKIQVREKVYQGSSQQWKHFKPFLNGALDYLDDTSVN